MENKNIELQHFGMLLINISAMLEVSINLQSQIIADQNGSDLSKLRENIWNDVRRIAEETFQKLPGSTQTK